MDTKDKRHDPSINPEPVATPLIDFFSAENEDSEESSRTALARTGGPMSDRDKPSHGGTTCVCDACHKATPTLYQADSKFWQCKKPHGNLCLRCWGNTTHCPKCGDQVRALPRPKKATPVPMPSH